MRCISKLVLGVAVGAIATYSLGCSEPSGGDAIGSGGSTTEGTGGTSETGGETGTGGTTGTGGVADTGGTPGTGGDTSTTSTGGTGSGGETNGSGGTSAPGGRTGIGGRTGVGSGGTGPGGRTGSAGSTSTGGTTGGGGATGTPPPERKFFGNIDTRGSIRSDFKNYWDQFSPENAGKWGSVQGGGQSSFNWGSLDKMYQYCNDNNIIFKQHCFIWGSQQPSWVNNSNGEAAVKAWMKAFCQRYPKTQMIDVVNEPLHPQPAYKEGIGGAGSSGWDWIANALKWAKEACPNQILIVNEYNTIEYSSENGRIISLANAVKKAGAPLDAIGCQAHDVAKVSSNTLKNYYEKIINDTGLPIYITELDIGVADDNQQAQMLRDFVTPAWSNAKVKGFTYWGYIVGTTWRSNTGLMTDSGTQRASMKWLMSFLGR